MKNSEDKNELIVSYLTLRKLIGILGIGLPIVILFHTLVISSCSVLEGSISAYYHTAMRDIFVGILWVAGFFMITYKGYDGRDAMASTIAGIFAIGVAMFPTTENVICGPQPEDSWTGRLHYISAAGLFITFACMSLWLSLQSQRVQ